MEVLGYEQLREERIKENAERMQKLGIFDLSLKLKSSQIKPRPYTKKSPHSHSPLPRPGPVRRSSRLQISTPVSYTEIDLKKIDKSLDANALLLGEEGFKPEVYTQEHEKMLGNTEMNWTLFVDGYGKDGKRIYDQVRGKSCHQCRQKTLGLRTHCSKCNMIKGQFCGDCLYMRYGENVLEANANPDWICPVCRGICNCSLCRKAKGWPATGYLYRKISSLGYKSVAHYLIQTRKANTDSDKDVDVKVPSSAKRTLTFLDTEVTNEESEVSKQKVESLKMDHLSEFDTTKDGLNNEEFGDNETTPVMGVTTEPLNDPSEFYENEIKKEDAIILYEPLNDPSESHEIVEIKKVDAVSLCASATSEKRTKKRVVHVPSPDSIGGRLRQRRNDDPFKIYENKKENSIILYDPSESHENEIKKVDALSLCASVTSEKQTKKREVHVPSPNSIGGRLRQRRNEQATNEVDISAILETDVDSIGRRFKRQRKG